jgi:hypothetical protein
METNQNRIIEIDIDKKYKRTQFYQRKSEKNCLIKA